MKFILLSILMTANCYGASLNDKLNLTYGRLAEIELRITAVSEGMMPKVEGVFFDFRAPNIIVAEIFHSDDFTEGEKQEIINKYMLMIEDEFKTLKVLKGVAKVEFHKGADDL